MDAKSNNAVIIYTDGACSGNPGPGGWGVFMTIDSVRKKFFGYSVNTTNNQMELLAALRGLEYLETQSNVILYTDSKYVQQGITNWIYTWLKNGWKNSKKEDVKNAQLWQAIYQKTLMHTIDWRWVKGHANNEGNMIADALAVQGRDKAIEILAGCDKDC
ncbi:Ribonuclease HI [Rickettsiales endosymbiont of Paramecium tredecaurelia]|uniref:ribonuclease HI n=1 Tax=Candidatus Sarmatiella mevalonica TaxID=2770581 RepID=UPI0019242BF4|nr:ribonuclease HI [Candidatus Sarmatiella mevalonica]MBL3284606.1 Ribonuclease HI [Candidatus Sarmatiella mevalonica]